MVTLNDYLYSGDTMFRILKNYSHDLKEEAKKTNNEIDLIHANFLIQIRELLEHNDFLTAQSQKIREFYIHMATEYPLLAFNFKAGQVPDPLGGKIQRLHRRIHLRLLYRKENISDNLGIKTAAELFPRPHRLPDRDFSAEMLPEAR